MTIIILLTAIGFGYCVVFYIATDRHIQNKKNRNR